VEIISVDKPATSPALAPTSTNADWILPTPKQDKLEKEISNLEKDVLYLHEKRDLK
jgi:hypothetical protein